MKVDMVEPGEVRVRNEDVTVILDVPKPGYLRARTYDLFGALEDESTVPEPATRTATPLSPELLTAFSRMTRLWIANLVTPGVKDALGMSVPNP